MRDVASIAAKIRSVRRATGISVRTVRAIETATGNPSVQAVIAAANVLGLQLVVR